MAASNIDPSYQYPKPAPYPSRPASLYHEPPPSREMAPLKSLLHKNIFHPVPINDFVHHVWGLDRATIQRIRSRETWTVVNGPELCDGSLTGEKVTAFCAGVLRIFWNQACEVLGDTPRQPESIILWNDSYTAQKVLRLKPLLRPDLYMAPAWSELQDPNWIMPWHVIEFKTGGRDYLKGEHSSKSLSSHDSQRRRNKHEDDLESEHRGHYKVERHTKDHFQFVKYMTSCLAHPTRLFATGLYFDRGKFSVWYCDSSCVLRTADVDPAADPASLAVIVYAIATCDPRRADFDPFFTLPIHAIPKMGTTPNIVGSVLRFPPSPTNGSPAPASFLIEKILHQPKFFLGRATRVYCVRPDHILKISWSSVSFAKEGTIIERVVDALPEWRNHLPEVCFYATYSAECLNLPRVALLKTVPAQNFKDREMHVIAMKRYKRLWEVNSVEEFMIVFIDCVECHYQAYSVAKVLHRDLSQNNLMFQRMPDGIPRGVLIDWDIACILRAKQGIFSAPEGELFGTVPFMACDLLLERTNVHYYRHDLESFFYILVWAAVHYDFKGRIKDLVGEFKTWAGDGHTAGHAKMNFIIERGGASGFQGNLMLALRDARHALFPWIAHLMEMFRDGMCSVPVPLDFGYDHATYDGRVTFETFMNALQLGP